MPFLEENFCCALLPPLHASSLSFSTRARARANTARAVEPASGSACHKLAAVSSLECSESVKGSWAKRYEDAEVRRDDPDYAPLSGDLTSKTC